MMDSYGIIMHHDAITGTERFLVMGDYNIWIAKAETNARLLY